MQPKPRGERRRWHPADSPTHKLNHPDGHATGSPDHSQVVAPQALPRPPIPPDYRLAIITLVGAYGDVIPPAARRVLFRLGHFAALTAGERLRLSVIASRALARAGGRHD